MRSILTWWQDLRAKTGSAQISYGILDVSSLASVNAFAEDFLAEPGNHVDILICNAGIMVLLTRAPSGGTSSCRCAADGPRGGYCGRFANLA